MNKKHFYNIFMLICLSAVLISPQCVFSADIELKQRNANLLLNSVQQALFNEWINITASPDFSEPEKQATIFLIKNAIQKKQLNFAFKELPKQGIETIIKTSIPLLLSPDKGIALFLIEKCEKQVLEKAITDTQDWLLQNNIKVNSGTLFDSFISYKGNKQNPVYHYNLAYKSIDNEYSEISIEFYSPDKIEPKKSKSWVGGLGVMPWEFDEWKK